MTEQAPSVREDLAFMRAIAEDGDPLPWTFGANLLVPGILFAPCAFLAWAELSGLADVPVWVLQWAWAPILAFWAPIWFWINRCERNVSWGPRKRAFSAAWSSMGLMTAAVILSLSIASTQMPVPFLLIWPSMALAIYGGVWSTLAFAHQRRMYWLIALGAFATAIACAFLVEQAAQWLILGFSMLAWIAAPGLFIILRARAAH